MVRNRNSRVPSSLLILSLHSTLRLTVLLSFSSSLILFLSIIYFLYYSPILLLDCFYYRYFHSIISHKRSLMLHPIINPRALAPSYLFYYHEFVLSVLLKALQLSRNLVTILMFCSLL